MKKATTRELRNDFARLARALDAGEEIVITKRGRPYAILSPYCKRAKQPIVPDFLTRIARYMRDPLPAGSTQAILDYDRGDR